MSQPRWSRVLLKLSGEMFAGGKDFGFDPATVKSIAEEVEAVHRDGVEVAIVVGGGNIMRGAIAAESGMDRVAADSIGMLATVQNALALQDAMEKLGVDTRVQTAIAMSTLAEPFIRRRDVACRGLAGLRFRDGRFACRIKSRIWLIMPPQFRASRVLPDIITSLSWN